MLQRYTNEQVRDVLNTLRGFFDMVRVVDPSAGEEIDPSRDGRPCHSLWTTHSERCIDCVAMRAVFEERRQSKHEIDGDEIYHVLAVPIELDGRPMAIELITRVNRQPANTPYSPNEFIAELPVFNRPLHTDALTGLFNRRYLTEMLYLLTAKAMLNKTDLALALVELNGMAQITAHYGDAVADEALISVGRLLSANVSSRRGDFVCRLSANTFAIVMDDIPSELFAIRLEKLCERAGRLRLNSYEDMRLSLCAGAAMLSEGLDANTESLTARAHQRLQFAARQGPGSIILSD